MGWVEESYSSDICVIVYEGEAGYVEEGFDYLCDELGVI